MSNTSSGKALKFRTARKTELLDEKNTLQLCEIKHTMKQGLVNKKAVRLYTEIRCLNNIHNSIFIVEQIYFMVFLCIFVISVLSLPDISICIVHCVLMHWTVSLKQKERLRAHETQISSENSVILYRWGYLLLFFLFINI